MNTSKEHYEYLQQLSRRLAEARDPLIALAAEDADDTLLLAARAALAAVGSSLHATALAVEDMLKGQAPPDMFVEAARTRNPEAVNKVDALIDRFRHRAVIRKGRGRRMLARESADSE
jgi:hypothetical protein